MLETVIRALFGYIYVVSIFIIIITIISPYFKHKEMENYSLRMWLILLGGFC